MVPHENNFLTILERKLNRDRRRYEVVNMGVPGIGIDSFYRILVREGLPEDPDMVIICFFIGNDFTAEIEPKRHGPASYLYSFLKYVFTVYPNLSKYSKDTSYNGFVYNDNAPAFELQKKFLNIESQRSFMYRMDDRVLRIDFRKDLFMPLLYLEASGRINAG